MDRLDVGFGPEFAKSEEGEKEFGWKREMNGWKREMKTTLFTKWAYQRERAQTSKSGDGRLAVYMILIIYQSR